MAVTQATPQPTHVGYAATDPDQLVGGFCVHLTAGEAIPLNSVVMVSTAADDTVLKATTAATGVQKVAGVCVGRFAKAGTTSGGTPSVAAVADMTTGPALGEKALVQVSGIATVLNDGAGTITDGLGLTVSGANAGQVVAIGATTTEPTLIGVAVQTATNVAATPFRMLIKL